MTTSLVGVATIRKGMILKHLDIFLEVADVSDEYRPGKILVTFTDGRTAEYCKKKSICILTPNN